MLKGKLFGPNFLSYEKKKEKLISEIIQCSEKEKIKISLYKNTSNLFRPRTREKHEKQIDVRSFNRVLCVDRDNLIADVEGMTTYEELVNETLKYSCLPPVVPELKSITIGGALSGCGIESSSFRYGLVHETIKEMEILLSDGRVVICNPNNDYKDLFFAFPNTFGTLGYALKIKVQLIPVKKYVKLSHIHFSDPEKYFEELSRLCQENREGETITNIDGVIFDKDEMYITTGEYVDEAPCTSQYRYMNIYYHSIKNLREDFLSSLDYIWRWDTDWFWRSKVFFLQNPLIRLLFGKRMLNSTVYTKIMHFVNRHSLLRSFLNSIGGKKESIIQDVVIPIQHALHFLDFLTREIKIKPIWICPMQPYSKNVRFDFCPMDPDTLYVDFGFWDAVKTDKEEGYYNKKIEETVKNLSGFKSLYSTSYYTGDEFWELYNRSQYLKLKKKYDPSGLFKDLYEKCSTKC